MNEPQPATGIGGHEAGLKEEPSPLFAMRVIRRATEPIGVIDVRHPLEIYARTATWLSKRFPLLEQVMARSWTSEEGGGESGGLVFKTMAEFGGDDEASVQTSPGTVLPPLTESPFSPSPSSVVGATTPSAYTELFRVSRRSPHHRASASSASGVSSRSEKSEAEMPQASRSIPRAKEKDDGSAESVTGRQAVASHSPAEWPVPDPGLPCAQGGLVLQKASSLETSESAHRTHQPLVREARPTVEQARIDARPILPLNDHGQRDGVPPLLPRSPSFLAVTAREESHFEGLPRLLSRAEAFMHTSRHAQKTMKETKETVVPVPSFSQDANMNLPFQFEQKSQVKRAAMTGRSRMSVIVADKSRETAAIVKGQQMVWQTHRRSEEKLEEVLRHVGRQTMPLPNHDAASTESAPDVPAPKQITPQPAARPQEVKLDIGVIAEKVSRVIARQLMAERERRGVSEWR